MLLSIVMMIKDEEKYLNKTLSALNKLRNKIKSELVILDTGSTDKSIEIASKYTDKVYFDEWNDNFSDMRNKSISYASGDWILILDADEELVSFEKMIEFFNSKLCKTYNSASIELNSIVDKKRDIYSKVSIARLFRNNKNFRYEGAIHEQPLLEGPLFNNIAYFNHYGYLYENEEIKVKKLKRNEKILFSEYKKNPNDPYTCYQLARNYNAFGDVKEALYYMEKSYQIYKNENIKYIPTESSLASIYLKLGKYENCKNICMEYIKEDDKNIDIYLYLTLANKNLKRYNEAIDAYHKYAYLSENYEISTQANRLASLYETTSLSENIKIDIIDVYYALEKYEDVLELAGRISVEKLRNIYFIIFSSLYELGREQEIINFYEVNKFRDSFVEKLSFKVALEKLIINIKKSDRERIYKVGRKLDGNYSILNEVRLGKKLLEEDYNCILTKENDNFYGDLLYYALEDNVDINSILKWVAQSQKEKYFEYLIQIRRECIFNLYSYLIKQKNTLNIEYIGTYYIISKVLLLKGNLSNEKYVTLTFMNIAYHYEYLKELYNPNLTDEQILRLTSNENDLFVINLMIADKLKNDNKLEYIKKLKEIISKNYQYKDILEVFINKFNMELDENEEFIKLKRDYKILIERNINKGNIQEASKMIIEYESMHKDDIEILNMKAILEIMNSNFDEADIILKRALLLEYNNVDTLFNIAYLKELLYENEESIKFYNRIINISDDEAIIKEAQEKINALYCYNYKIR